MINHQGVWLPDGETHLTKWMTDSGELVDGKGTYQIKKLRKAVGYCTNHRTAVDIGAHVGLWSMQLVKMFDRVVAFEPVPRHRECFMLNVMETSKRVSVDDCSRNFLLHHCALGESEGFVDIETAPTSSGDSRVDIHAKDPKTPLKTLDSFGLTDVDFMKLDCEGYELFALRGGVETIRRCLPIIIVEQKPGRAQQFGLPETGAVGFLIGLGYTTAAVMSGDYVMVPE